MNNTELTVVEHIEELRKRLYIVAVFFIIAVIGSFFLAEPLIHFLQFSNEAKTLQLHAFKITDPVKIYFQVIFILATIMTSPVILYQLWAFISPGLYVRERRATLRYIPYIVLLFIGGILFSYEILFPYIINFMAKMSTQLDVQQTIGINEYFQFLIQITLPFGIVFELPMVVLFLTRLGIITPQMLKKVRKYAYFILLVVADLITPTDVVSLFIVAIPLCILYEISIIISRIGYRKYLKAEQQRQMELVVSSVEENPSIK
ncbi:MULTISPECIES: twin-arginine translocase subunit TatC [Rummeliibacillus]|jgi:Sec-independent protein translocase TatC|uniref:twin-arginine translocase subunit TatC n=1 Tax=Rummeliibacillus TaxID=648802 RepID=UPI0011B83F11|nr:MULTISPECIES: twin-arginine translocase subunit TatC [Rummeliibacillus]MBO2537169.1 twin-arginine translocase subunit TatC [Rummeliibacillus suwonensis]